MTRADINKTGFNGAIKSELQVRIIIIIVELKKSSLKQLVIKFTAAS